LKPLKTNNHLKNKTMYNTKDEPEVTVEDFSITYDDSPFCECCGERFADFGVMFHIDGTSWCANCFKDMPENFYTKKEFAKILKKEKQLTKEYYKNQIKRIEKK